MTATSKSILDLALALPPNEREELAENILASIEPDGDELTPEQIRELDRRVKEIDDGTAKMVPLDEAFKMMRERRLP